jgi:small subunit ribosomal protein S3
MSAINNVMKNNFRNLELDEFLSETLRDAGYGRVDVQKKPIGTRITLSVTRPGLVIGRKGSGIKDLTSKLEQKFGLSNPQISVIELEAPELNPKIMCNRIAQLIERGTAFRRAAIWTNNTIMNAGALGVEITVAGKLRSERAHFEKHAVGLVPKSGDVANKVVRYGITHVTTKMGLMGIQLKIALKNEMPKEFEMIDSETSDKTTEVKQLESTAQTGAEAEKTVEENESVAKEVKKDG